MKELRSVVEKIIEAKFNSCLLNLYHNGDEGMAWHSDDEKALGKNTSIASLSLGAERKFALKHKTSMSERRFDAWVPPAAVDASRRAGRLGGQRTLYDVQVRAVQYALLLPCC